MSETFAERADRIAALYATHAGRAIRFAYLMTGSREDAEDLVQEAFVRATSRLTGLRAGVSRVGQTELFRIKGTRIVKEPIQWPGEARSVWIADMDDAGRGIVVGSFRGTKLAQHPIVLTRCIG